MARRDSRNSRGCRGGWRDDLPRLAASAPYLSWLREPGSLTARLKASCREFSVRCLRQGLQPVGRDEGAFLGLRPGTRVWVREVLLCCDDIPVVFAHTVMARRPRHPFDLRFGALGERSLGSLLFSDPCIVRGKLQFRRLDARHPLFLRAVTVLPAALSAVPAGLWARRSGFGCGAKTVLVNEVFLPALLKLR